MTSTRADGASLTRLVVRISRSWRSVLLVAVLFGLALGALMAAVAAFADVSSGLDPFDLQNRLTGAEIRDQLAQYSDDSTGRYLVFAAVDLVFPFLGGLLLASVTAACLRSGAPGLYERAVRSNLLLLFFVPTLLDWTENVFAIWLVVAGSPASGLAVTGLVVAKTAKLIALTASQLACVAAILCWAWTKVRRRNVTTT